MNESYFSLITRQCHIKFKVERRICCICLNNSVVLNVLTLKLILDLVYNDEENERNRYVYMYYRFIPTNYILLNALHINCKLSDFSENPSVIFLTLY